MIENIYKRRFNKDKDFRILMWKTLYTDFFKKYINKSSSVVDIGAGYCEFINSVEAKQKIAVDVNPETINLANSDVIVLKSTSSITTSTIDIVFISNLFEHLTKQQIQDTIEEVRRILRPYGKLLILYPNIRYCYKDYWMFFDHITPLDDKSIAEILEINNFVILENLPKFLPFTTKSIFPKSIILLKIYLKIPILQKIFGQQGFMYLVKK